MKRTDSILPPGMTLIDAADLIELELNAYHDREAAETGQNAQPANPPQTTTELLAELYQTGMTKDPAYYDRLGCHATTTTKLGHEVERLRALLIHYADLAGIPAAEVERVCHL